MCVAVVKELHIQLMQDCNIYHSDKLSSFVSNTATAALRIEMSHMQSACSVYKTYVVSRSSSQRGHKTYNFQPIFGFLPARRYASAGYRDRNVSVRLSVRLSVTRRYCVKTKKASVMISLLSGSPKTLVF